MKKGMILTTNRKWATVFTEDCQLEKLPIQPHMAAGKEIILNMQENTTRAPQYTRRFKPALVAASFVLVLAMTLLLSQGLFLNPVYATVSVDINPSVQFSVNRNLEVVEVKAMNQEAAGLLEGVVFQNMGWTKRSRSTRNSPKSNTRSRPCCWPLSCRRMPMRSGRC